MYRGHHESHFDGPAIKTVVMTQVPSVPSHGGAEGSSVTQEELIELRRKAVQAITEAEEQEKSARQARRIANRLLRQYELMVDEYNGQLVFPEDV